MRRTLLPFLLLSVLAACSPGEGSGDLMVDVVDAEGGSLGTVSFTEAEGAVTVEAAISGVAPGQYGFHIHETGECDSAAPEGPFTTAGGHYNPDNAMHPEHAGDLPPLYATQDGTATLTTTTDRFELSELTEGDGSAVIVHEMPDNLANIPDRYAPEGVDEDTTSTGDAGGRQGCGLIEPGA